MITTITDIIIIIILIVLSALFSSSETALTTISPHRLRTMVDEKLKNAETLEEVLENREKMLSVILICNNIVNIAVSSITTVLVQKLFGNWAVGIGTGVLTLLILIFGEITPKTIATYRAEKLALAFAPPIKILMLVFTPIAAVVNFMSSGVLKLLSVSKKQKAESYTENEIRSIVEVSSEEGSIEDEEKEIINNVFDFTDTIAREVMVPRPNIVSASIDSTYDEIRKLFMDNLYTRIPVFNPDGKEFAGMINLKDFIFIRQDSIKDFSVSKIMRPLLYTYEQKHLSELFVEMKRKQVSMMAVMDEYGVTVGVVTMEDLLEELVGDIRDEYDADEEDDIKKISDNYYEVQGSMNLSDINDRLGIHLVSDNYDSVGGLMMEKLDRIPEKGESVRIDHVILTADETEGSRINKVKIKISRDE